MLSLKKNQWLIGADGSLFDSFVDQTATVE